MNEAKQSHWINPKYDKESYIIRTDILNSLSTNEHKLSKIKSHIIFQILTYPYMKKLQKERVTLLSNPDFLWMLQQREEKQGFWRGWYDYLGFHTKYNYFFISEDHSRMSIDELNGEFRTDLLTTFRKDLSKYDPFPKINYRFILLLLGIYANAFLITFALCVIFGRLVWGV
ncbi:MULTISPECIES: hypothetical protein [Methanobacterium]|uniref:Uncharacterized protein n=1 Tax=Methanobacterium bryantii TaxID=2161 RepID=A0A2A2H8M2_METBR|nr:MULTISPECIES: hypothetical protein [Methanobacterium]OEC87870.1 hypothetical protein A9507_06760 [Methanobacterium sp. A39]PAV05737.1 hypothetical protein ASJ80_08370 [Methanobacterium bryantii]